MYQEINWQVLVGRLLCAFASSLWQQVPTVNHHELVLCGRGDGAQFTK